MSNEQELEQEIQDKGLTAPRLTPALIDAAIKDKSFYVLGKSCVTICCLTLVNGFTVTGESACASPENFDAEIGEKIAFDNAKDKIWMLEGYLLKEKLSKVSADEVTMKYLLEKMATDGGSIVSSANCSEFEISEARARGDLYVDENNLGYVRRVHLGG